MSISENYNAKVFRNCLLAAGEKTGLTYDESLKSLFGKFGGYSYSVTRSDGNSIMIAAVFVSILGLLNEAQMMTERYK